MEWCENCKENHNDGTHGDIKRYIEILENWGKWIDRNKYNVKEMNQDIGVIPIPEVLASCIKGILKTINMDQVEAETELDLIYQKLLGICSNIYITGLIVQSGVKFEARTPVPDIYNDVNTEL